MKTTLKITGAKKLSRFLDKTARELSGRVRDSLDEMGDFLMDRFDLNFDVEGDIVGMHWVGGPYYHKLQRTGRLRKGFVKVLSPQEVMVKNTIEYAIYHQTGRGVPQRPIIGISNEITTGIIKIIQKNITDILQRRI